MWNVLALRKDLVWTEVKQRQGKGQRADRGSEAETWGLKKGRVHCTSKRTVWERSLENSLAIMGKKVDLGIQITVGC